MYCSLHLLLKLERYELAAEAVLSENNIYLFIITQELRIIYFTKDEIQMLLYIKIQDYPWSTFPAYTLFQSNRLVQEHLTGNKEKNEIRKS